MSILTKQGGPQISNDELLTVSTIGRDGGFRIYNCANANHKAQYTYIIRRHCRLIPQIKRQ